MSDPDAITEGNAEEQMARLRQLMPALPSHLRSTDLVGDPSTYWTPEEMVQSRAAQIQRHLNRGWKLEEGGLLRKGNNTQRIAGLAMMARSDLVPYDPARDAFALRLGARYVSAGRYELPNGNAMDAWGRYIEADACPGCGSSRIVRNIAGEWVSGGERRLQVQVQVGSFPWQKAMTYCRVCSTPADVDWLRNQVAQQAGR